jgi:hypothetical protein
MSSMKRLVVILAALAAVGVVAGCGGGGSPEPAERTAAAPPSAKGCPQAWRASWQRLANEIRAPVYCPSWMPHPLNGRIGGEYSAGRDVEPDRSYLVAFLWQENTPTTANEVHVNFRGYPGRTAIPACEETLVTGNKSVRRPIPCFGDASPSPKRFPVGKVTVYTVNQGVDQWHVLYAWRRAGSLYTLSQHVALPYTYAQVISHLDRMVRGLVLIRPTRTAS